MYFNGTKCCSLIFCSFLSLSLIAKDAKPAISQGLRKPLCFVENKGQVTDQENNPRNDIQYKLSTPGMSLYVGNGQLHYQFKKIEGNTPATTQVSGYNMNVTLLGANPNAKIISADKQEYFENYYVSQYSENGFTVHSYNKIIYKDVYPAIDWVLYVKNNKVEYDFVVHPGGDIHDIRIAYNGATALSLTKDGGISAETPMGRIGEKTPYAYETSSGKTVASKFVLKNNVISFETGAYEGSLTIDPYLLWSTYFGGTAEDVVTSVKESAGNTYAGGYTASTGLSFGAGIFQAANAGGTYDAFVAKFTNTGTLTWATYFGGTGDDQGTCVAFDNTGTNLYLVGSTTSPATGLTAPGTAWHTTNNGGTDGFLIKFLASNGSRVWCTFFGGAGNDVINGVACDGTGNVYITGQTASATLITFGAAYQATLDGANDAFVAQFNAAGAMQWSTYYGGPLQENGLAIACNAANDVIITGQTNSTTAMSSFGNTLNGANDAFVAVFNTSGARLWGNYFGGPGTEQGNGVICDPATSDIIIVGNTTSASGIASPNAYQIAYGGGVQDAFVSCITNTGTVSWSTYYGGNDIDYGQGICLDVFRNIVIAGGTMSTSGIASSTGGYQTTIGGSYDAFVAKLTPLGQRLWGSYYGSTLYDFANAVACDPTNNEVAIAGYTNSTAGIATAGTYGGGTYDGFVTKFYKDTFVTINQPYTDTLLCPGGTFVITYSVNYNFQLGNIFTVELSDAFGNFAAPVTIGTITSNASGAISCTIPALTALGTAYRIRIRASNPVYISPDDMLDIQIDNATPNTTATGTTPTCVGGSISLFDAATYSVTSWTWAGPNGFSSGVQNPTVPGPITIADAGTYSVTTTHAGCPPSTTTVTIVVNTTIPPTPSSSVNGHCVGSAIYLFANPDTTAGGITYSWSGPLGFSSTLQNPVIPIGSTANAGYYYVTDVVAGCPSGIDSVYVTVSNTTPVSIAITVSPGDTVCQGTNVTFTATTSTGGATPTYQWVNGSTPVVGAIYSTWSTPTLINGNRIYCILNSSLNCPSPTPANSNVITMDLINNSPLVYISASAGPSVPPGSPVTFSSIAYNAGPGALYQWSLNSTNVPGATNATYTLPSVTSYDTVSLIVTSIMACATPNFAKSTLVVHAHTVSVANVTATFDNLELFPNPNNGSFTLKGDLQNTNTVSIDILNTLGQVVYGGKITTPGTQLNKTIDLCNLPNGIYLLHIYREGESKMLRFSVQH
ncbi:MAG: T9SS type A sorting domain-containing protein [Chitinophagales bacterium]